MVTNANEGNIFVNENFTMEMTLTQYVTDLMPQFNQAEIDLITNLYENTGETVFGQASLVMGECAFRSDVSLFTLLSDDAMQLYLCALHTVC